MVGLETHPVSLAINMRRTLTAEFLERQKIICETDQAAATGLGGDEMNGRYLPNWLYAALPYSYFGVGILVMIVLQSRMAMLSGLTLIVTSGIVCALRLRTRPKFRNSAKAVGGHSIVEISWKDSYESGHRIIDEQRRRLFGLCNALVDAVLTRKPKADVELMLHDLLDHIVAHFASEERLSAEAGHPLSREHKDIHGALLAKAGSLQNRYRSGEVIISDLIGFITYDIVTNHIIGKRKDSELGQEDAVLIETWTDTEAKKLESADTVLKMIREQPEASGKAYLSIALLDKLTPEKVLFHSYPHVWQRICVFLPEPAHLERYLNSLLEQDGGEGVVGFSLQAMKEIGEIYTQNLHFLPKSPQT